MSPLCIIDYGWVKIWFWSSKNSVNVGWLRGGVLSLFNMKSAIFWFSKWVFLCNENHGSTTTQGELNSQRTEWFKIMETIAGWLPKSGQPDASAEGNIDCDLGIYTFGFQRHLKRNRKSKEIKRNKKLMHILHAVV